MASRNAYDNYFGRFNYDFKAKYLLEFLFRYDGSQIFPQGKRYGFFPGISGAWRLSEENFVRNALPFVNSLKLRASYGELGNDRVGAFQYLQFFGFGGNYVFGNTVAPGLTTGVLPNPNITWERAKKTDIGLEATLWNGKLGVDLTLWQQKRRDILINRNLAIPSTMGFPGVPPENFGKVNSQGLELILSHRNSFGPLKYDISGNVAYSVSKVIELDEVPPAEAYQNYTGTPIGSSLYYKADGVFNTQEELDNYPHHANSQVGDIKVVDLNKDGVIDSKDQYRFEYTATPRYVFGLNTNFQFKNFDLNIFFQGQTGVYNYDGTAAALGNTDFSNASVWRATDRWTESNPNGTKPRADAWQPGNTTFFLFDATFIRLKTIELGYNLPSAILERTKALKNVRLFASAFNLATWSKEIKWADPELNGNFLVWPPQRIINFGISVNF
ncbi:TonB-dependent receptor SusC [Adhaeribacter pallidiroseus]|uniref:TonB-dependent receptor SusC n=1 Tax=Adhaeribacter pallidiroseus TaxID=2072847 RepID=A0A369QJU5_9BACT|nr:TonB-dependent receptor SusC [Adhaeribacter pallidiroseus]